MADKAKKQPTLLAAVPPVSAVEVPVAGKDPTPVGYGTTEPSTKDRVKVTTQIGGKDPAG